MRICLVSFEYPPFHGGGIGTYAAIISRWLAASGHEVHVIANGFGASEAAPLEGAGALQVHRIQALDRAYEPCSPHDRLDDPMGQVCRQWEKALYWSTLVADTLAEIWRDHELEVVEFPECFAEGYVALRRRETGTDLVGLPMCVHLHTPIREHTELNLGRMFQPWFRRRVLMEDYCITHADRLSSPSRSLADIVRDRLRLDRERHPCDVIPYAVDFDSCDWQRAETSGDEPSLLFVGRIEARKGVKVLVEAAVRVMTHHPTLTVHLVGRDCDAGEVPGSMQDFLLARIPEPLRERFVFEGLRPREEVLGRYAQATACVFPAPWDNFPFTCFEAMSAGGCVIASDRGGMAEVVEHERSGLVFRSRDVDALAATIERVLAEPELAARLRARAARRVREVCDPQAVVRQRTEHYRQTIQDCRKRAAGRRPEAARARQGGAEMEQIR